ncbi:hypothetical protein SAMN04488062_11725 [Flavobacterium omnivorum]|uniref:Septum formation initiator n=1 Tax=Flavobacterium omnivorum TaxID=178355 RepID=A0A1G8G541_9FLAO|nr:septum formation initiator [Flavobacterium omnivorum]SDH89533.1 hypothetical protein SAMN04488062_11725 [Flavobacterium omnivorum]
MKKLTIVLLLFSILGTFAQSITKEEFEKKIIPLNEKIRILQSENNKLKSDIVKINSKVSNAFTNIDNLQKQSDSISNSIVQTKSNLISKIETSESKSNQKISAVGISLNKNSFYGIIAVLIAILLSALFFWLINKRQKIDKLNLVDQLNNTKSSIEESLVKEFGKQTELMETQLHLIEQQKTTVQNSPNLEPDHSLALKLSSQINVMENNLNRMDQSVKGIKNLRNSISNLKDNLSANGYEMPVLLGKQFHQGMKVIVTSSIPDENLEKDSEIITKVLIPQVNYNDKMIQTAQIEVSVGY